MKTATFQRKLRNNIVKHFSLGELQELAFDLGTNWDELSGRTISTKCQSLILYMQRHDDPGRHIKMLREERPEIAWSGAPA